MNRRRFFSRSAVLSVLGTIPGARRLSDVTGLRLGRIPLHLLDRKTEVVILVPRQVEE